MFLPVPATGSRDRVTPEPSSWAKRRISIRARHPITRSFASLRMTTCRRWKSWRMSVPPKPWTS